MQEHLVSHTGNLPYLWRGKKYTLSGMGAFLTPICSLRNVIKTILPHICEDLIEGLEPLSHPLPPKKPTF